MAVLVTGGTGYIGSVAVEVLRTAGERVVVLDDLFRGHRAALPEGVPLHEGNVGDRSLLRHLLSSYDFDACIHFAALTDWANPLKIRFATMKQHGTDAGFAR